MAWEDYESVSWFIQSSSSDEPVPIQGSAIAVRLYRTDEPDRTYLLTCAHVVRGSDPSQGTGPVLANLRAWRAGSGFTDDEAQQVQVVATPHRSQDEPVPDDERAAPFDWVLLQLDDKAVALAAPAVPFWAGPNPAGRFLVCGYPGEEPFSRSVVKPTITDHCLTPFDCDLGVLRLNGDETRPGMSGGGLFDTDGLLVGIHRSKRDSERKLVALSAEYIRDQLKKKGFRVFVDTLPAVLTPIGELIDILSSHTFREVNWREVLNRYLPQASVFIKPHNLRDDDALVASLQELQRHNPDARGVFPLHGFVLGIHAVKTTDLLAQWIAKHVPEEARNNFQQTLPVVPKGEPRIVVQMVPTGPIGDAPELSNIEYKIWFRGFQRSHPMRREVDQLGCFDTILASAWKEVSIGETNSKNVWVELFLPKELLNWKFESLKIRMGKTSVRIGSTHPFALRLLNREGELRLKEEKFDRSLRLHRYESLASIPYDCGLPVLVEAPGDSPPDELFMALQGKESILGVMWTSPPQTVENDDADVWDAVSQAGVPLVLWLRDIPPACPDVGAEFHDKKWDELGGVVKRLRNSSVFSKGTPDFGQHLAVIIDDDQRKHPDEESPFCTQN